jgi:hypothetical protein
MYVALEAVDTSQPCPAQHDSNTATATKPGAGPLYTHMMPSINGMSNSPAAGPMTTAAPHQGIESESCYSDQLSKPTTAVRLGFTACMHYSLHANLLHNPQPGLRTQAACPMTTAAPPHFAN